VYAWFLVLSNSDLGFNVDGWIDGMDAKAENASSCKTVEGCVNRYVQNEGYLISVSDVFLYLTIHFQNISLSLSGSVGLETSRSSRMSLT